MKIGRQAEVRGYIVAAAAIVLVGFFSLVRAQPRAKAQVQHTAPAVNYESFFAPSVSPTDASPVAAPHTRTRAS